MKRALYIIALMQPEALASCDEVLSIFGDSFEL